MATSGTSSSSGTVLEPAGPPQQSVVKEESNPDNRASSPDPSCSICLDNVTDAAYTDMCCHRFCFQCLVSWSRVKPECPLCKQRFNLIIHNVRSISDYDELPVTWPESPGPSLDAFYISVAFQRPRFSYRTTGGWRFRFHDLLEGPSSMSSSTHSPSGSGSNQVNTPLSSLSSPVILPISAESPLFPPVTSNTYMGNTVAMEWRRRRQVSANEFRASIYQHNQWVVPPQPRNGVPYRIRECSPSFYSNNPAQINRLIPWIRRELLVLLERWQNYDELCARVLDAVTHMPIRSQRFHMLMWPHIHDRTAHFIHEFYHFAISPYDMFAYDLRAEYVLRSPLTLDQPPSDPDVNSDSSDIEVIETPETRPELIEISDDDDDDVIRVEDGGNDSDASVEIISSLPPLALREPEIIDLVDDSGESDVEHLLSSENLTRVHSFSDRTTTSVNNSGYPSYPPIECPLPGERLRNKYQPYYKDESSSSEEEVPRRRQLRKRKRKSEPSKKKKRLVEDYSSSNEIESDHTIQRRVKPSTSKEPTNYDIQTRQQTEHKSQAPSEDKFSSNNSSSSASSDRPISSNKKKTPQSSSSHLTKVNEDVAFNDELNTPEHVSVLSPPTPAISPDLFEFLNDNETFRNNSHIDLSTFYPHSPIDSKYQPAGDDALTIGNVDRSSSRSPSPKPRLKSVVKKVEPSQEAGCSSWPLHNLRQRKVTRFAYTPYFSYTDSDS